MRTRWIALALSFSMGCSMFGGNDNRQNDEINKLSDEANHWAGPHGSSPSPLPPEVESKLKKWAQNNWAVVAAGATTVATFVGIVAVTGGAAETAAETVAVAEVVETGTEIVGGTALEVEVQVPTEELAPPPQLKNLPPIPTVNELVDSGVSEDIARRLNEEMEVWRAQNYDVVDRHGRLEKQDRLDDHQYNVAKYLDRGKGWLKDINRYADSLPEPLQRLTTIIHKQVEASDWVLDQIKWANRQWDVIRDRKLEVQVTPDKRNEYIEWRKKLQQAYRERYRRHSNQ